MSGVIECGPLVFDKNEILDIHTAHLDFNNRILNAFEKRKIITIRDLVSKSELEVASIRNLGAQSVEQIKSEISAMGLSLSKTVPSQYRHTTLKAIRYELIKRGWVKKSYFNFYHSEDITKKTYSWQDAVLMELANRVPPVQEDRNNDSAATAD